MSGFSVSSTLVRRAVASPNFGERRGGAPVDMLVLHYTGCPSAESALLWMCSPDSQVSAHYLVDEDGEIIQLVDEAARAWHAGAAFWAGETDINSRSVGIEIQNPGHLECPPPPYPNVQMEAVITLCRDIMVRHGISPLRVVGHSDVAPARKTDPGEHFPWHRLAEEGLAFMVEPAPLCIRGAWLGPGDAGEEVARLQDGLARIGYGVGKTGVFDELTEAVVRAFQRRFRPQKVDGVADASTMATLERVLAALDNVA